MAPTDVSCSTRRAAYSVTECYNQRTDNAIAGGFSFANYKAQIDAGYPVLLNLQDTPSSASAMPIRITVYLNDTWDHATHQMTWGGSYSGMALQSVSVVNPVRPNNPVPTITGLNPTSATAGGSGIHAHRQWHELHGQLGGTVEWFGPNNDVRERHTTDGGNHCGGHCHGRHSECHRIQPRTWWRHIECGVILR